MTFYVAPNIPTVENINGKLHELTPDPVAEGLQRQFHSYYTIDALPIYQPNTTPVDVPDVPYNYGLVAPFIPNEFDSIVTPGTAPDIQWNAGAYDTQVIAAASPKPQLSAMGVYGPLRAPGINEGY